MNVFAVLRAPRRLPPSWRRGPFLAILIAVVSLTIACSSTEDQIPTAGPDRATPAPAATFFAEDAIALVRTYSKGVPFHGLSGPTCFEILPPNNFFSAQAVYESDGLWTVYVGFASFAVYENTGAVRSLTNGFC